MISSGCDKRKRAIKCPIRKQYCWSLVWMLKVEKATQKGLKGWCWEITRRITSWKWFSSLIIKRVWRRSSNLKIRKSKRHVFHRSWRKNRKIKYLAKRLTEKYSARMRQLPIRTKRNKRKVC